MYLVGANLISFFRKVKPFLENEIFNIIDHLVGNGRVFFSDMNKDGIVEVAQNGNLNELLQQEHYYPFGMGIKGEWKFVQPQIGGVNKYQYNGIELNDDFGLNWNMAFYRSYDPSIGRWGQVDPEAESYLALSLYNGLGNNPITYSDPLGDKIIYDKPTDDMSKAEKRRLRRFNTQKRFNVFLMRTFGNKELRGMVNALAKSKDFHVSVSIKTGRGAGYNSLLRTAYLHATVKESRLTLYPSNENPAEYIRGSDIGVDANELYHAWFDMTTTENEGDSQEEIDRKDKLLIEKMGTTVPDLLFPNVRTADVPLSEIESNKAQNNAARIFGRKQRLEQSHTGYRATNPREARVMVRKLRKLNKLSPIDIRKPGGTRALKERKINIIEKVTK